MCSLIEQGAVDASFFDIVSEASPPVSASSTPKRHRMASSAPSSGGIRDGGGAPHVVDHTRLEMVSLEDRIRAELTYLGLIEEEGDINKGISNEVATTAAASSSTTDKPKEPAASSTTTTATANTASIDTSSTSAPTDDISRELVKLQTQLRTRLDENTHRRERLAEIARYHMAWQEFNALLDEQNKLIEAAYAKRFVSLGGMVEGRWREAYVFTHSTPFTTSPLSFSLSILFRNQTKSLPRRKEIHPSNHPWLKT